MRTKIQGVIFDHITMDSAISTATGYLNSSDFHYIVTPNPEIVMHAQKDPLYQELLNRADLSVADGIGIIKAAAILGTPLPERIPGIELAEGILSRSNITPIRLYLLGARPEVVKLAASNLAQRYPGITICGYHDGYFSPEQSAEIANSIRDSSANLLFVCLGFPKQEQWISQFGPVTGVQLAIGLGGALDVFSGVVSRAPEWWCSHDLEWAYRLAREPKRFLRIARLPWFLVNAVLTRIRGNHKTD